VALPQAPPDAFVEPPGAEHPAAGVRYADAPAHIREPRALLLATVAGWRIGSTHLSHVGSGERLLQAAATVDAFGDASPSLLLGDLNAPIDAPELAPLSAWTDAFREPPDDTVRISTDDGWRIDQVLLRGGTATACSVRRDAGNLSDHFPVVAEVTAAGA
jgi:endonuclease/exonuclease/phosphatase family metal-dependent hydrolase